MFTLLSSRRILEGVGPPVLCHSFMERLFCLPMYKSVQSWLRWTALTTLFSSRLGVMSLGWTSFCLSVLAGLKSTGIWCLLKISLLRCSCDMASVLLSSKLDLKKPPGDERWNCPQETETSPVAYDKAPTFTMTRMTENLHHHKDQHVHIQCWINLLPGHKNELCWPHLSRSLCTLHMCV